MADPDILLSSRRLPHRRLLYLSGRRTYAEATWTQSLADWIGAHTRAFEAIGGVPRLLVPDNTKTAIIKACLYEPQVNRTYTEMAAHYGTGVLPARPRRPRDKAKVEVGVLHTASCGAAAATTRRVIVGDTTSA